MDATRVWMRRHAATSVTAALLGTALLGAAPVASSAQGPIDVRAGLSMGWMDAHGRVANAPVLDDPGAVFAYGDFASSPAVGLKVDLRSGGLPLGLRLSAYRSLTSAETGTWGCGVDEVGVPRPCPSILIETVTDMTLSAVVVSLIADLAAGPVTIHPTVGIGAQRWSYSWDPTPVGSFSLAPGTHRSDSATLYGGVAVGRELGRVRVEAEYGAYRSRSGATRPDRVRALSLGASMAF